MTSQVVRSWSLAVFVSAVWFFFAQAGRAQTQNSQHAGANQTRRVYPQARQVDQIDVYHGVEVKDPFRALEDMQSIETQRWVQAQDSLSREFFQAAPARAAIRQRVAALWHFDLYTIPAKAHGRYFYAKTAAGKSQSVLLVQDAIDDTPRVVVDPPADFNDSTLTITGYWPSPNGKLLAYGLGKTQSRWWRLKVVDVARPTEVPDELLGLHNWSGSMAWTKDNKGFFYVRFDGHQEGRELQTVIENPQIYYHRIGTAQNEDQLVYARPDKPKLSYTLAVTVEGRYLVMMVREGSQTANRVYYKDLQAANAKIVRLFDAAEAAYTFLGNHGSRFWFYTDREAPRGRVVAIDILKPQLENWREVIPQAQESIAGGSLVGGDALGLFGNHFVIMYQKDGSPLVKVFDLQGRFRYKVDLPGGGSIWGGLSGRQDDHEVFYQFLGLADPSSIHRLNLKTGERTSFRRSPSGFDPNDYVTRQIFYNSKDGARVPMFIAHKKGIQLDGHNPALIYGYGAFGWSSFLWYQPHVLVWMEMGGVYAQPSLRGGGEYGEAWHQAGSKLRKQNAIDDYVAAVKWLIANKYTSPAKMAASGGSASGSLAGAAMIQHPELFRAGIIDRPALDMIRFEKFTSAGYWVDEFGSAESAEEFKALYAYSPYHNIKPGQCYPATLVMAGDRDEVTAPMHAYKFTAALQTAQGCENPVLLRMMWGTGHNFGATPEQVIDTRTDELAFLVRTLDLNLSSWRLTQNK